MKAVCRSFEPWCCGSMSYCVSRTLLSARLTMGVCRVLCCDRLAMGVCRVLCCDRLAMGVYRVLCCDRLAVGVCRVLCGDRLAMGVCRVLRCDRLAMGVCRVLCSTCFGCQPHPSSVVHKTVTAASVTGHIFFFQLPPSNVAKLA